MSRRPRVEGFNYLGFYRYFVTFCTFDRRHLLSDVVIAHSVLSQFRRISRRNKFTILAYCLMPDHVHLLVEGRSERSDFRGLIKSLKQSSGQRYASARYIVENPVRAGLVRCAADYPLVGSHVWTLEELIDSLW
jgi:putative transposase